MKLCKDCQYFKLQTCHAPQSILLNPVTGKKKNTFKLCRDLRVGDATDSNCGYEGSWFKEKSKDVVISGNSSNFNLFRDKPWMWFIFLMVFCGISMGYFTALSLLFILPILIMFIAVMVASASVFGINGFLESIKLASIMVVPMLISFLIFKLIIM